MPAMQTSEEKSRQASPRNVGATAKVGMTLIRLASRNETPPPPRHKSSGLPHHPRWPL